MRNLKAINKPTAVNPRTSIVSRLLLVFALLSLPAGAFCETEAIDNNNVPVTEVKAQQLGFDPALVGLPDFPIPLSIPEDFDLALELIEARILELRAASRAGTEATAADVSEKAFAGATPVKDPRIAQLVALRDACLLYTSDAADDDRIV